MPVALAAIDNCTIFINIPGEIVQQAAGWMDLQNLRRREVLGSDMGFKGLGVVLSGTLQAVDYTADGKEVALLTAGANEAFGLAELLATRAMPLTWMAGAASTTVALMPEAQARMLLRNPDVALKAANVLAQQVCDAHGWQKVRSVHPVGARVAAWIRWQMGTDGNLKVPTHAELAWQLNTTRESITRVFQKLLAEGVLARNGEAWRVSDSAPLADWLSGRPKDMVGS